MIIIIIIIIITVNIIMLFGEKKKDIPVGSAIQSVPRVFFLWEKKSKSEANDTHTLI